MQRTRSLAPNATVAPDGNPKRGISEDVNETEDSEPGSAPRGGNSIVKKIILRQLIRPEHFSATFRLVLTPEQIGSM